MTPEILEIEFKAYNKKRKTELQDIWLQGAYIREAILSSVWLGKGTAPNYPEMPFGDDDIEELKNDEKWLAEQRALAYNNFMRILSKKG